mmetsp:Transcript_13160/g.28215  ORF Transcript_13160/g.28215 Transcript_13160/m.28215 type:complete len:187 (+) Transcript_13160:84-644(+)
MSLASNSFISDFEALSKLVKDPDEDPLPKEGISRPTATPAAIGPKELLNVQVPAAKARKDPKEIWDEDEILDVVEDDIDDGREMPVYEFMYKQAVETTDVFLGMSGKDESSTSCEELVVRIELPEVSGANELDLDVKPTYLKLSSTKYKLSIHLPHKVLEDKGKAKWDSKTHELRVTLPIVREDEF